MEKQPCVYMLSSRRQGTLYIGVTSNLPARLYRHREGLTPGFASRYGAIRLVWFEVHETMTSAIVREKPLKKWNRDWKASLIEAENPHWSDLAIGLGLAPAADTARRDPRLRGDDGAGMQ